MGVVSSPDTLTHFEDAYNTCSIRYGDMKKQLAEDMIVFTAPLRERILELSRDEDYIHKTATRGAEKARESASATVSAARQMIGFRHF
jgi:tryptophanyl-tRNA synthetase